MEKETRSAIILLCALLIVLTAPCLGSHEYPKICNYFTGYTDLEYCEMLSRWDVVVLTCNVQDVRPGMVDSLRALNPDITLLTYYPVAIIWGDYPIHGRIAEGLGDKVEDCDWWLYDNRGNRIVNSDNAWFVNISTKCPKDANGQTSYEWMAQYLADEIIASGMWDGVLIDGFFERAHWINNIEQWFEELPAGIDANLDGVADPAESLNVWWGDGIEAFLSHLRGEIGDAPILVGNGKNTSMAGYLNGGIRENFPFMHGGWEPNMFADYGYLSLCRDYLQDPMNLTLMLCHWMDEEAGMYGPTRTAAYERFLRYTLASSLLGDGYYVLHARKSQLWWEDLYELNMGTPLTDAYPDSIWNDMYGDYSIVWRRDFSNGVVYCNPYEQYLTLEDGTWLGPEDGRIKSFTPPSGTTVEIIEGDSQREFDQTDGTIAYSAMLANSADEATYSYVWANLMDGADTLVASAGMEYLLGAGDSCAVDRSLRIRGTIPCGTYCLEVLVGTEAGAVVDRDTILVERTINFRKVQRQDGDLSPEQDNLLVFPQPMIGPDAMMKLEVKGTSSSSRSLTVRLYDVRGRLVRTIIEDEPDEDSGLEIGMRTEGGGSLVPGVYFVAVETGDQVLRKKVVLLHN
ncbi:putative glycoside hydrolase [Candidatus Eisenbacteria bacterium]|uniref:Glycoside hydrolase n=1 Tax=Eiseniibacteriota bacterium TaxID=2212470 RepID=A0ABV6YN10_UNCEI